LDAPALLATLSLALLASLAVGLVPALQALTPRALESLRQGARIASDPGRRRGRALFIVSEVALAFALLVGAGLMIRSLAAQNTVRAGFEDRRVLTLRVQL